MSRPTASQAPLPYQTICVTGATGFVGRVLVRELLANGVHVRAFVRNREQAKRVLPVGEAKQTLQLFVGENLTPTVTAEFVAGADACINLVGILREQRSIGGTATTFRRAHVETTRLLVSACESSGVRRYIQMSALGVSPDGASEYQRTKFEAEQIVRLSSLDWTIMRPGLIHGPQGEFIRMMRDILEGAKPPYVFAPYFQRGVEDKSVPLGVVQRVDPKVQPVAVEDVAAAFVAALRNPDTIGEVYNLVGGEALDWPSMLRWMRDKLHAGNIEPAGIPAEIAAHVATIGGKLGVGALIPFDSGMALMGGEDTTADTSKAKEDLEFQPRPFREAFAAYADQL